ncbi:MAG: DUF6249 domain-containing protein [Bacteroidales bacterium]
MDDLIPIFVLAIIFGSIVSIVYLSLRKKERMAMMDKGVDASIFFTPRKNKNEYALKYGLLLIGLALGILMGNFLITLNAFMYEKEAAYFSMILLFGGLALIIYYFMAKTMFKEDDGSKDLMKKE